MKSFGGGLLCLRPMFSTFLYIGVLFLPVKADEFGDSAKRAAKRPCKLDSYLN